MKTIILTGGGTAGHCTPHFAIIEKLKARYDNIYYIGSINGIEKRLVEEKNIPYHSISTTKLKRSLTLENLSLPFKFIKSVSEAKKLLLELKPDVVFSKGGFVGLPVTIASHKLKIPVVIHESDKTLGLANKLSSRFAKSVLTTFDDTCKNLKNGVFVGAIIREELSSISKQSALKFYGLNGNKPVLLITGGSLGARKINQAVLANLGELLSKFDVIHIVGKNNLSGVKKEGYKEVEFTDMKYAYATADICVSRAGSNTIFELLYLKIPTLLIPLPKDESRGDQLDNAEYFYQKGVMHRLFQEDLDERFLKSVFTLYDKRNSIKSKMQSLSYPVANEKIIEILTSV